MVYWKHTRQTKPLADAATQINFDLPDSDFIGHAYITERGTAGALAAGAEPNLKSVFNKVKIEMDGKIVKSLTPEAARVLGTHDLKNAPVEVFKRSAASRYVIPILFGRYLWDREVLLPAKISDDDLSMEMSVDDSIDSDAFATGTVNIDLDIFELKNVKDIPSSKYYVRSREVDAFTTAASGDKETDLPRGDLYRRALVMCEEAGIEAGVDINALKWHLNNQEITIIDSTWENIRDANHVDYGLPVVQGREFFASDADTLEFDLETIQAAVFNGESDFNSANVVTVAGQTVTIGFGDTATPTANTTDEKIYGLAYGYGFDHSVMLDIMRGNNIETAYDSSGKSNCKIVSTQGGAGGAASVTLEELVKVRE